jgi:hypothetical protein
MITKEQMEVPKFTAGSVSSGKPCPWCGEHALDEAAFKDGAYWHFGCLEADYNAGRD